MRRLFTLIQEFEAESTKKELSLAAFDSPSWAYQQAFLNGQRSAYTRLKELLEIFNS